MFILHPFAKVGHAYFHSFVSYRYRPTLLKMNCLIKYIYAVLKFEERFLLQLHFYGCAPMNICFVANFL